ncbi:hypothetical protein [Oxalobacter paraformigenes]|uniref:hypothetical protein n=1 Tax=Oxalobacter paraformigenes TaxID=556268 RepID=UPI00059549FB|nr:hypothetical protein [Oxalobacter paraformigenes]
MVGIYGTLYRFILPALAGQPIVEKRTHFRQEDFLPQAPENDGLFPLVKVVYFFILLAFHDRLARLPERSFQATGLRRLHSGCKTGLSDKYRTDSCVFFREKTQER